jgi:hypothetical protein
MGSNPAVPALVVLGIILAVLGLIVAGNVQLVLIGLGSIFAGGLLRTLEGRPSA